MTGLRARTFLCMAFAALLVGRAHLSAQTAPLPASNTSVAAPAGPLLLPGTLQLTSVVNQTPAGGAVPTGTVSFYSDTTNLLGSAPLAIVPSTQAWAGSAVLGTPIANPIGVASVILTQGGQPVIVSANAFTDYTEGTPASVTLYKFSTKGTSLAAYTFSDANLPVVDSIASGYFLQAKSTGVQSFLVHGSQGYLVFDGSTTEAGQLLNAPLAQSDAGCDCSSPDQEAIAIDDFDNDGYSDAGVLFTANGTGPAGIVLNAGASNPGALGQFIQLTTPSSVVGSQIFCPIAITTGHFISASPGAQLAVLATTPTLNCQNNASPGAIYLFALSSDKTTLTQVGTPLTLPDADASILAAADLNKDGNTDLIIGESIGAGTATVGGLRSALGNGDGSFQAPSALLSLGSPPGAFTINDFNGDGIPDFALTSTGGYDILLNDGSGNVNNFKQEGFGFVPPIANVPGGLVGADLNGDGLADLAIVPGNATTAMSGLDVQLNSAASQATLSVTSSTTSQTLPAGTHTLTATYSGDANFATSTSTGLSEIVNQTVPTITWTAPGGTVEYATPVSTLENATASVPGAFTYNPATGILPPGPNTVAVSFIPTDIFDYAGASASIAITVGTPSITSISPDSVILGSPSTTITVTGLGFVSGSIVNYKGSPLTTTYIDQHHLGAVIPAASLAALGNGAVTVVDPGGLAATGSQTFTVAPVTAVATVSASETTVTTGDQSTVTLSLNAYPVQVIATATLVFTPDPPNTVGDPMVLFTNNSTTNTSTINPSTTASTTPFAFQAGSTAGTIKVTIHLTLAGGQDITPSGLAPITIAVPPAPPVLSSPTLTPSGQTLSIVIPLLSSTRDMTSATFHFTAAAGKTIKTPDVTVQLTSLFQGWYGSAASDQYGTSCLYTQSFTIDGEATDVGSVTVTLTNSNGPSEPSTVQPTAVQ
jgi:hypothetical protein